MSYQKVQLEDGTTKRISIKRIRNQTGGRPTGDIDRDFDSESVRIGSTVRNGILVPDPASWYDLLQATPEYLIDKCKGKVKPKTAEYIRTWGPRLFKISPPPAPRNASREEYEAYLNRDVKQTERQAYRSCSLGQPESRLPEINKLWCEDKLCNPVPHMSPISNEEGLVQAISMDNMPEDSINQLTTCFSSGYRCNVKDYPMMYDVKSFTYVRNGGSGDCLFIAFANYMHIVNSIGGVFPDPRADNTGLPPFTTDANPEMLVKQAATYRSQTVKWLRDNLDSEIPGLQTSLRYELALNVTDTRARTQTLNPSAKTRVLQNFTRDHGGLASELGINSKTKIDDIFRLIGHRDEFLTESPAAENAFEVLCGAYAEAYLESMSSRTTYGGQPEIIALAIMNQVDIAVLQRDGDNLVYNSGYTNVPNPRGLVFIFHNMEARASSGFLHYEIMFPLKSKVLPVKVTPKSSSLTSPPSSSPLTLRLDKSLKNLTDTRAYLWTLKGDAAVRALNIIFDYMSKNESMDKMYYEYITHGLAQIRPDQRGEFIVLMPLLMYRRIADPSSILDEEGKHDRELKAIFRVSINNLIAEQKAMQKGLKGISVKLPMKERFIRVIMENFDIENMTEDETRQTLESMNLNEMYELIGSTTDIKLHSYFIVEFMTSDLFMDAIGVYARIKGNKPQIPGVNLPLTIDSVARLYSELTDMFEIE